MNSSAPDRRRWKPGNPDGIRALVIGYGNGLRRDDGAGPAAARIIGDLKIPGVTVDTCHQLLPEHAATIAEFDLVVFIDSAVDVSGEILVRRLQPAGNPEFSCHQCGPEYLLDLCVKLAPHIPQAWMIHIPGTDFGIGEGLSPAAADHVQAAVLSIAGILRQQAQHPANNK